jgi:hypothetical protein
MGGVVVPPIAGSTPAWRPARVLAACVLALAMLALATPAAQAGCTTRLPVNVSLPDGLYALAYTKHLRVRVAAHGSPIRNLRAELYTFSGRRMGVSRARRRVRRAATLELRLERIFRPLQAGAYTLVVTGEPNASRSCGPKQVTRLLRLSGCKTTLPMTFPRLPGGRAADYGHFLSVPARSDGGVISDVRSSVFGFDGSLLGRASTLGALFGEKVLDHRLLAPLQPGSYTVVVEGFIDEQPRACGRQRAQATMTFE